MKYQKQWKWQAGFVLLWSLAVSGLQAQEAKKIVYEYEKYNKIDLGSMAIDGKIVIPADLTVIEQDTSMKNRPLYNRRHFLKEMQHDLISF